jgi:hypothetical protein
MLDKIKKIGVIIVIAILFSMFCFSLVDVAMERPNYSDYCDEKPVPLRPIQKDMECPALEEPSSLERAECSKTDGNIEFNYDNSGCPVSYECNTCRGGYEEASENYRLIAFIISTLLGISAVIAGMYIKSDNEIVEWVYAGIVIGGIATIFIGTMQYFGDMGRFIKPFILLAVIALIIWVAVRTAKKKK